VRFVEIGAVEKLSCVTTYAFRHHRTDKENSRIMQDALKSQAYKGTT